MNIISGELELFVTTEENKCGRKIENIIENPSQLTDRVFEFNGDSMQFIKQQTNNYFEETPDSHGKHKFQFLFKDSSELLFDLHIEDSDGKPMRANFGIQNLEEDLRKVSLSYFKKTPKKGSSLIILFNGESCKVKIPFEFENVTLPKKNRSQKF